MALNLKKSEAIRSAEMQAVVDTMGAGAKLKIYSGTQPATPAAPISGPVLLATLLLPNPIGTVLNGVLTFGSITSDTNADATDTAAWFSLTQSDDDRQIEGTVGTSGTDLIIDDTSIVAGQTINASSLTLTAGNA